MNYSKEELNLILLDSFEKLSYKNKYELLSAFSTFTPDWKKSEQNLIKTLSLGVYNKIREDFSNPEYLLGVLQEYERLQIECVTYFSSDYPEELKHTPAPPIVLYCKGNTALLSQRKFAVVGSRRTPPYAEKACRKITQELSANFVVVTGIADGADTAALESALESGTAICVLAHGFNYVYPAVNKPLLQRVVNEGLVISEHLPQIAPRNYLFPVRNRIIAGLSEGTLIVSAAKKSGALITANYAMEYGKEVFAFPYNVGVTYGEGCNALIKKGANLCENILDIASVFGLDLKTRKKVSLSTEESKVLKVIKSTGSAHINEIALALNLQTYELFVPLSSLEIKGLIVRMGGNRFGAV
ncbi:MAG: DNA-processing protein DprA [Clostridia bacterium]|nr:DNA-processing protein DprA [Clostridia bacterium]